MDEIRKKLMRINKRIKFAWFPTLFWGSIYIYLNVITQVLDKKSLIIYCVLSRLSFGILMALSTQKFPFLEILTVRGGIDIVCIGFKLLVVIDCFVALLGGLIGLVILKSSKNVVINAGEKIYTLGFSDYIRRIGAFLLVYLPSILFFMYCVLLLLIYIVGSCGLFSTKNYLLMTAPIIFFSGTISGFITKKIPMVFVLVAMLALVPVIDVVVSHVLSLLEVVKGIAVFTGWFLANYIVGALIGYNFYLKTRKFIEFKKFEFIKVLLKLNQEEEYKL